MIKKKLQFLFEELVQNNEIHPLYQYGPDFLIKRILKIEPVLVHDYFWSWYQKLAPQEKQLKQVQEIHGWWVNQSSETVGGDLISL